MPCIPGGRCYFPPTWYHVPRSRYGAQYLIMHHSGPAEGMLFLLLVFIGLLYVGFFLIKPVMESFKNQHAMDYRHEYLDPGTGPTP